MKNKENCNKSSNDGLDRIPNGLTATDIQCYYAERFEDLMRNSFHDGSSDINDMLERYVCSKAFSVTAKQAADEGTTSTTIGQSFKAIKSALHKKIVRELRSQSLPSLFESICLLYKELFVELLATGHLYSHIEKEEFENLLLFQPGSLSTVLLHKPLVDRFDGAISDALRNNPNIAIHLIIKALAQNRSKDRIVHLPTSLEEQCFNKILEKYLEQDLHLQKDLEVLNRWRSNWRFKISPENKEEIKHALKKSKERALKGPGCRISIGTTVAFLPGMQHRIEAVTHDTHSVICFSLDWIKEHHDFPSLINNFMYPFCFNDMRGLIGAAKPVHTSSVLASVFVSHTKDDYSNALSLKQYDWYSLSLLPCYRDVLRSLGTSLEELIEWFFNVYLEEEYNVGSFDLHLPRKDKPRNQCLLTFMYIEPILRKYAALTPMNKRLDELSSLGEFQGYEYLPSALVNKYAILDPQAKEEFKRAERTVLQNTQCNLPCLRVYPGESGIRGEGFEEDVASCDYMKLPAEDIEWLSENGFLCKDTDESYIPADKLYATKRLREDGCLVYERENIAVRNAIDALVEEGYLKFLDSLLAPNEAELLSFLLEDRKFAGALALRNKYAHGDFDYLDSDNQVHKDNYNRALFVLILLVLKINEEFFLRKHFRNNEDCIDQPYIKNIDAMA